MYKICGKAEQKALGLSSKGVVKKSINKKTGKRVVTATQFFMCFSAVAYSCIPFRSEWMGEVPTLGSSGVADLALKPPKPTLRDLELYWLSITLQ